MAGGGISSAKSGKSSRTLMTVLGSALLEWLLMFLLFLNAIFAYIITRFARYCELPIPCLLCSRLDHVLGGERVGFYWDLICSNHKLEISSLVLCHFHNKLVDVHGMCESCLFSFATKDKSNAETYRLLVGKVGADPDIDIDEAPLLDDHNPLASTMKRCNCCTELWSSRRHPQMVLRAKSPEFEGADLDVPLFTEFRQNRNDIEKRDQSVASSFARGNVEDALPHFGYKELKITSDTESECQVSDNEDSRALVCEPNNLQGDLHLESLQMEPQIITLATDSTHVALFKNEDSRVESVQLGSEITVIADDASQVSSTDQGIPTSKPAESTSQVQYIIEHHDSPSVTPSSGIGHRLEEHNWPENDNQARGSPPAEPHFGYEGLKIISETESESQVSDNEGSRASVCEMNNLQGDLRPESVQMEPQVTALAKDSTHVTLLNNEDSKAQSVQMGLQITMIVDDASQVSSTDQAIPMSKPAELTSQVQYIIEHNDSSSVTPSSAIGHGLEELNWPANDNQPRGSPLAELINLDDESDSLYVQDQLKAHPSPLTELINIDSVPESLNTEDVSVDRLESRADLTGAGEIGQTPVDEFVKIHEDESEHMTADLVGSKKSSDSGLQTQNFLDLGDAYKLAISNRGRQLSGKLLEKLSVKDSTRVSEDLKLLLSQLSASRGFELPLNEMKSPRVSGNLEELKTYDSSDSIAMQILQKRISLERNDSRVSLDRNESGIESLDVSIVSEIEGESELDRLKRQVEHDKKLMSALCKELEEERNASTIAANQALAMITRLQEEKATMQMEALHDIRLMEEQAEYDVDALEKLNDLLTEKEKEIQDLEAELEYYRRKYPDATLLDAVEPTLDLGHGEKHESFHSSVNEKHGPTERVNVLLVEENDESSKDSWLELEDERLYISRSLSKLERKLYLFSNKGVDLDLTEGDCFGKSVEGTSGTELHKEGSEKNNKMEENDVLPHVDSFMSRGSRHTLLRRVHSLKTSKSIGRSSLVDKEADIVTLGFELSSLNDRLQALEADRNFLEHAINLLKNGDQGLHFIQEIASNLRELRRIGIGRQQLLP